jgi:1-acyl-sn-glycerol-3-phosphate acyltransferase
MIFYGMGFRYELIKLTDKKIDKDQQYVIIANHTSIMDIMLPVILFPKHPICFVGKKELVKIPIFGTIYKRICVMVDRSSARSRALVYKKCAERMAEGEQGILECRTHKKGTGNETHTGRGDNACQHRRRGDCQ